MSGLNNDNFHLVLLKKGQLSLKHSGSLSVDSFVEVTIGSKLRSSDPTPVLPKTLDAFLLALDGPSVSHVLLEQAVLSSPALLPKLQRLGSLLRQSPSLAALSLSNCLLLDPAAPDPLAALAALLDGLPQARALDALALADCALSPQAVEWLLPRLPPRLLRLDLSGTPFCQQGLDRLAGALPALPSLDSLALDRCFEQQPDPAALCEQVLRHAALTALQLEGAPLAAGLRQRLVAKLGRNKALQAALQGRTKRRLALRGLVSAMEELEQVPWAQLTMVSEIDLRDNPCITYLPPVLRNLPPSVTTLKFDAGQMTGLDMRYAMTESAQQMLRYLDVLSRSERFPFPEVKLLVVGKAAVGKTTLIRRLRGDGFTPLLLSTDGIDLGRFQIQDFGFISYDFGGQKGIFF